METSLFPKDDNFYNNVHELHKKIENSSSPTQLKHRSTIVKYTKIADYESEVKVSWPLKRYTRLRLFTTLNDDETRTIRSLKSDILFPIKMTSGSPKRKIVTITEDDETDLHPKFSRDSKRSSSTKTSNKSVATRYKEEKLMSTRNTSRFSMSSKYANETKSRTKINNTQITKEINLVKPINSRKYSIINNEQQEHGQLKNHKDNGMNRNFKNSNISKTSVSKNVITSKNEEEISLIKTKLLKDVISNVSPKKPIEKSRTDNSSANITKSKVTFLKEIQTKNKPVTVIHVPLEEKYHKINSNLEDENLHRKNQDCGIYRVKEYKNVNIGTEPSPTTLDQVTEMNDLEFDTAKKYSTNAYIQTEVTKGTFDSLEIPNVTLIKDKSCVKDELDKIDYKLMPDIQMPSLAVSSDRNGNDEIGLSFCTSYIISRATLTYTTQQKINFHMVESNGNTSNIQSSSPLYYPVNVVSVFKNEINRSKNSKDVEITNKKNETKIDNTKCFSEVESLNCSYGLNGDKLVKPSDIIRTIKVNTGFLQNEYMYDEFQRELNFIDSFFESLQYLENSSMSSKCFSNEKVDNLVYSPELLQNVFTGKSSDYDTFFTKLNNDGNIDDTETMTSKSLCLLNSLIRDEQRRAKNLLFVLKMREDALKEFATSQILWLENKKKHDNTDVSVLKKKQRGALLKLQHECGEMQRMRKALLTLSEKRKVALMKTKKCLELKLKNNVDVDQIVLGKKKLKKNTSVDRNTSPLKCFDLSSSGCEESSTSKQNISENAVCDNEDPRVVIRHVRCAEKSIQTGDDTMIADKSTETAAENFVVVDGGYLNILFHNLSLPQIFSSGKQYEVNEEALKNIVNSSNSQKSDLSKEETVEKLIDSKSSDGSSSRSTARSLVEEFDQYYKGLDREMSPAEYSDQDLRSPVLVYEMKDTSVQVSQCATEQCENRSYQSVSTMTRDSNDTTGDGNNVFSIEQSCMCEALDLANSLAMDGFQLPTQAGPLPVPVGAAAQTDNTTSVIVRPVSKSTATSTISETAEDNGSVCPNVLSTSSLTTPAHCEAEELRRQQLAIEREIKALEQEQCQLLVVREIPDKPPPPYTPPADTRVSKPSPVFLMGESTEEKIRRLVVDPDSVVFDTRDHFNVFLNDFCHESLERRKLENSDEPWDACNLLPQKRQHDTEKLVQRTSLELSEVLNGVTPTFVSGVGARRSDHIDDILFAEWRRCEPEWTSLHTDEASVKNQIFDCIFQKILTETVDEYKKIMKCKKRTE